jgi:hypothetical protein
MSSVAISSGLRKRRVNGRLRDDWRAISCARLALSCSAAAKLAPGPEKGRTAASESAVVFEASRRGDAKRS